MSSGPERRPTSALVSVIIPVFNRLTYLPETMCSVLAQTFQDWELLVVDDGSNEDVEEVVSKFNDPRVQYVRQENRGNASARNTGVQRTRGEYVSCLDSDDVWQPDMLEETVAVLDARPSVDVVFTQHVVIDAEGRVTPAAPGPPPVQGQMLDALLMGYPILPSSALTRRACFERWGLFTPGLDDWELWLRWAAQGCQFYMLQRSLLQYRIHDQNLNLAWESRRKAHLAMLDSFYAGDNVPQWAVDKKRLVYANQHFQFSEKAWAGGMRKKGVEEFALAVQHNPQYLRDIEFYYRLACAHQPRLDRGTRRSLDLDKAESTIKECLENFFERLTPNSKDKRKRSAYAYAYLSLARVAYSLSADRTRIGQFLQQSLSYWPAIVLRSDWAAWRLRLLLKG